VRILKALAIIGVLVSASSAAPLCVNDGSLQSYITTYNTLGNACQIGDKLFWGFNLNDTTGFGPDATQIQVQPIPFDGISNIGISFNSGGWIADPGFPIDAFVSYNVATLDGQPHIDDATLSITGTLSGGGATATVTETLTPAVSGSPLVASLPSPVSDHIVFASTLQTSLFVKNEINLFVDPRFPSSSSHVSVIENDFSENITVPEPLVTTFIGSGLLLFGFLRRKRA
jgi:hypothetical protein